MLTFLTLAIAGYLLLDGKRRAAAFVLFAVAGAPISPSPNSPRLQTADD